MLKHNKQEVDEVGAEAVGYDLNENGPALAIAGENQSPLLSNVVMTIIKPERQSEHPDVVDPTRFDLRRKDVFVPLLLVFKNEDGRTRRASYSHLVNKLKESLRKILVPYYTMAGHWVRTGDVYRLLCHDQGVPFIEAFIDQDLKQVVNLENFKSVDFLSGYRLVGLDPINFTQPNGNVPLPSAFVQVTGFKCGGLTVVITFNHTTVDGVAMGDFVFAWAEMARRGELSVIPSQDRTLITNSLPKSVPIINPLASNPVTEKLSRSFPELSKLPQPGKPAVDFKETYPASCKTLMVKADVIDEMKRWAKMNYKDIQFLSTVDCISGHIWRALAKLPIRCGGTDSTTLWTAMDGRQRFMDPPIIDSYFGNCSMGLRFPPHFATDLLNQPSAFGARVVHKTIERVNPSYLQTLTEESQDYARTPLSERYRHCFITSWLKFPLYDADFGFGRPAFACCNYSVEMPPLGFAFICPPIPGSGTAAVLQLFCITEWLNLLLADPEFLSMFHKTS